jgi:outer membrane protein OmpA-like peptidoglycan-associated protein
MRAMEKILGRSRAGGEGEGAHWLSVSDLMAGLMMVFLFIAIALMRNAFIEKEKIREIAVAYQQNQVAIYELLVDEFQRDLDRWDAAIDKQTLAFEFRSPDVLFERGDTEVRPNFRAILSDFFPRYLQVLEGFRDSINEIRIEGHTSSDWGGTANQSQAYFMNMRLSQGRTRSVLEYAYGLPAIAKERDWVRQHFAAVGFASSRLVLDESGAEDRERSRRVTFRVVTNAEVQIRRIIDEAPR